MVDTPSQGGPAIQPHPRSPAYIAIAVILAALAAYVIVHFTAGRDIPVSVVPSHGSPPMFVISNASCTVHGHTVTASGTVRRNFSTRPAYVEAVADTTSGRLLGRGAQVLYVTSDGEQSYSFTFKTTASPTACAVEATLERPIVVTGTDT